MGIEDLSQEEIKKMREGKASNFASYPGMHEDFAEVNRKIRENDYEHSEHSKRADIGEPSIMAPTGVSNAFEDFIARKTKEAAKRERAKRYAPNPYTIEKKNIGNILSDYYKALAGRKELYTEAGWMMQMYENTGDSKYLPKLGKVEMNTNNLLRLYDLTRDDDVMAEIYARTIPSMGRPVHDNPKAMSPMYWDNEDIKESGPKLIKSKKIA